MPAGENNTQGWHEDFGDEPSVEERIPEGWDSVDTSIEDDDDFDDDDFDDDDFDDDDFDDDDFDDDAELVADRNLERQELEDFEQADEYFNHYDYGDYGGEG